MKIQKKIEVFELGIGIGTTKKYGIGENNTDPPSLLNSLLKKKSVKAYEFSLMSNYRAIHFVNLKNIEKLYQT